MSDSCSIPGCQRPIYNFRGWCKLHYNRWSKHGSADWTPPTREDRFWSHVDKSGGPDACWLWTGYRDQKGYGQSSASGRPVRASRVAWSLTHGDPGELFVCHRCDNPPCCNPAHLFLGTNSDNIRDAVTKGRHRSWLGEHPEAASRGETHPSAKLTDVQVDAIRSDGRSSEVLGAEYGVAPSTIRRIRRGERRPADGGRP